MSPDICTVMAFADCVQDYIYEYGDNTYPTTGKQAELGQPNHDVHMFNTHWQGSRRLVWLVWPAASTVHLRATCT